MAAYIDLSEKHGHRDDHGFACGAEFNVKIRRRINVPDFVREKLSQGEIDEIWWEEAGRSRDGLKDALSRRYKWIGEMAFVGRGPGWLAIEDTGCRPRNWDTIGKVVDQYLKEFIKSMEAPSFWGAIEGLAPEKSPKSQARHHATRKRTPAPSTRRSPAQLEREIAEALSKGSARSGDQRLAEQVHQALRLYQERGEFNPRGPARMHGAPDKPLDQARDVLTRAGYSWRAVSPIARRYIRAASA